MRSGYTFALVSDIHIDLEGGGEKTYFSYAQENFSRALNTIRNTGCEFVISAGDQVTNASGAREEWQRYRQIIVESRYQGEIFEALGNHETRFAKYGGCSINDCIDEFIIESGLKEKPVLREEGAPYYEMIHPLFKDCFLFMALEGGYDVNRIDCFSDAQVNWVEERIRRRLREHRRVFLIEHAPLYGFGVGDDTDYPAYEGSIRIADKAAIPFNNNLRFKRLIEQYRDVIWLSGHTHLRFEDGRNYSNQKGEACHMIHIPALSGTTRLTCDEEDYPVLDRSFRKDDAQGYLVNVYEDKTVFTALNFISGERFFTFTVDR